MGDLDGGWYENGIYHLTLTFSPDFPEVHPRPKFVTKMFHPQINEDGFPYLSVSMADSKVCIRVCLCVILAACFLGGVKRD
jgi:ubiquitin-protein ligase